MKTALLFPGQASQYVGMGADLYDAHPAAREMYDSANAILSFDIAHLSFHGPAETLVQTAHTQPAIFIHSCVMHRLASEVGLNCNATAGHSLGEYSALVAANVLSYADALIAVRERARLMQEACEANPSTMAAVLGLDYDSVVAVCKESANGGVVTAANYNGERQIVISGDHEAINNASELAKQRGAKRVIPLAVGGAFHSSLMQPSPEKLKPVLNDLTFTNASVPVVLNVTGEATTDAQVIRKMLIAQLTAPVLWHPTLNTLKSMGIERVIEVGPKKVLLGLAKPVFGTANSVSLDTNEDLQLWMESVESVSTTN